MVGLVPLDAMISAGKYYLKKQGRSTGIPEQDIIECAVQSLGLNDVTKFKPDEKIIDYAVSNNINSLVIGSEYISSLKDRLYISLLTPVPVAELVEKNISSPFGDID